MHLAHERNERRLYQYETSSQQQHAGVSVHMTSHGQPSAELVLYRISFCLLYVKVSVFLVSAQFPRTQQWPDCIFTVPT